MTDTQIKELLENLDKLAYELRDSPLKQMYGTRESHIATVRTAQSLILSMPKESKS